ncbi:membrane protein [Agaricicola taiwanensis]|uniref:Membrane protein n=1 Tax=Agaricicola taiwanensis TaxID=591372 RepID=A0A8J2YHU8_9RHOB|nr:M23 family metallopeptidase [Agaricicola taiwanensis]GGE43829.1 membrane protein [Agaricicola taiwanensis]
MTNRRANRISRRRLQFSLSLGQTLGILVIIGGALAWSMATAGYILFKDDVLLQFAARHKAMQEDYETRLAELRRNMEQIRTAGLAEKAMLGAKLDALIQFQAELQERQDAVAKLVGAAPVSPLKGERNAQSSMPKPRPLNDGSEQPEDLSFHNDGEPIVTASLGFPWRSSRRSLPSRFEQAETGYHRLRASQENLLATLETRTAVEKTSLEVVYNHIGVPPSDVRAGIGGPFIEMPDGDSSDVRMQRIRLTLADVQQLRQGLTSIPIGMPAKVKTMSSDFGSRMDPFLGRPAFHSGIDFSAPAGTPIHATASGRVAEAGRNGGYGLMVEVAHDHGLTTRYAHMSSIAVQEGARIEAGQLVGYVGSTGRSTGPHLHYETRRNDKPLDPTAFIEAGRMAATIER